MNIGVFLRRFLKFFLGGVVLSALGTLAMLYFNSSFIAVIITSIIVNAIFFVWIVIELVNFRLKASGKKRYYTYTMPAMGIYCFGAVVIPAISGFLGGWPAEIINKIYTFMFLNFKSIHFYTYFLKSSVNTVLSAFLYSVICFAIIAIVPLFVNKKKLLKKMRNEL